MIQRDSIVRTILRPPLTQAEVRARWRECAVQAGKVIRAYKRHEPMPEGASVHCALELVDLVRVLRQMTERGK